MPSAARLAGQFADARVLAGEETAPGRHESDVGAHPRQELAELGGDQLSGGASDR